MLRTIRWGILGAGRVAHQFAQGLNSVPDAQLVAVASRTEEKARNFAKTAGDVQWHTDCRSLCMSPDVDVIYIATPNNCHKRDVLDCLEAEKAVLCEKPFAIDAREAEEMVRVARARNLFCMEAMWPRFLPLMRQLDDVLDQLGELRMLTAQLGHPLRYSPQSWQFRPGSGGGATLDLGVYLVSLAVQLFGAPTEVAAHGALTSSGVDEHAAIVLQFAGGEVAALTVSLRCEGSNDAVIVGRKGRLRLHPPLYCPYRMTLSQFEEWDLGKEDSNDIVSRIKMIPLAGAMRRTIGYRMGQLLGWGEKTIAYGYSGNGFNYEAAEVVRCLHEQRTESDIMPLDDTLIIAQTLDAIRERLGVQLAPSES